MRSSESVDSLSDLEAQVWSILLPKVVPTEAKKITSWNPQSPDVQGRKAGVSLTTFADQMKWISKSNTLLLAINTNGVYVWKYRIMYFLDLWFMISGRDDLR